MKPTKPIKVKLWLLITLSFLSAFFCFLSLAGEVLIPVNSKPSQQELLNKPKLVKKTFPAFNKKYNTTTNSSPENNSFKNTAIDCSLVHWAKWSQFLGMSATGTIDEGNGNAVNVIMTSNFDFSSTPQIYNLSNAFSNYSNYSSIPNETVPKTTWSAGAGGTTNMKFSHTVTNPVLLIASLGQQGAKVTLNFSLPYVVLYPENSTDGSIKFDSPTTITGQEGNAVIMFPGNFDQVTILSSTPEDYTNITWGISPPTFSVTITPGAPVCGGTTATVTGGVSYLWSGGDTPTSATNTFHTAGRYTVTATDANGCRSSQSAFIDAHVGPTVAINGSLTGCGEVTLTASGGKNYQWDGGDTPTSASNTFHTSGTYQVIVSDASGCPATDSRPVTVNPSITPTVSITSSVSAPVCAGTPITYSIASLTNGGDSPEFSWLKNGTFVAGGKSYTPTDLVNGDKIECALKSHLPCAVPVTSNTITADIKEAPTITFPQKYVIDGRSASIQLNPVITGDVVSYLWTPATGLSDPTIPNPVASPEFTTDYTLTVQATNGCPAMANTKILVLRDLIIPNTFTPNGDGINDTWNIVNLDVYVNATIDIYNRYGANLYHAVGYASQWDGTYKGKTLPAGTYYYVINPKDGVHKISSGWVAILR